MPFDVSFADKLAERAGLVSFVDNYMTVTLEEFPRLKTFFGQDASEVVERVLGGKVTSVGSHVLLEIYQLAGSLSSLDALFPSSGCLEDYVFQNMLVEIHSNNPGEFQKLGIEQGLPRRIDGLHPQQQKAACCTGDHFEDPSAIRRG